MLKLRWLRMIAIHDLTSAEYDLVVDYTTRYQIENAPSFTEEESESLDHVYLRVRELRPEGVGVS